MTGQVRSRHARKLVLPRVVLRFADALLPARLIDLTPTSTFLKRPTIRISLNLGFPIDRVLRERILCFPLARVCKGLQIDDPFLHWAGPLKMEKIGAKRCILDRLICSIWPTCSNLQIIHTAIITLKMVAMKIGQRTHKNLTTHFPFGPIINKTAAGKTNKLMHFTSLVQPSRRTTPMRLILSQGIFFTIILIIFLKKSE